MCVKLTKRFTRGRVQRSRKWTPGGQLVCVPARSHRTQESFYRHRKHRGEPGHTHGTHGRAHTSTWMTDHSYTQKNPPIQTFYRYHDRYSTGTVPVVIFSPMVSRTDSRHHSCDTGGPRHRRRQRTLECGPAQQRYLRHQNDQHDAEVSVQGTPSFLMLKMELLRLACRPLRVRASTCPPHHLSPSSWRFLYLGLGVPVR